MFGPAVIGVAAAAIVFLEVSKALADLTGAIKARAVESRDRKIEAAHDDGAREALREARRDYQEWKKLSVEDGMEFTNGDPEFVENDDE